LNRLRLILILVSSFSFSWTLQTPDPGARGVLKIEPDTTKTIYDMAARGINNNNPLNIVQNGDTFQGEIRPSKDRRFKQFSKPADGYRAAFVTLGTYLVRDGKNTIDKIIQSWAPPVENDTTGYVSLVEKWSGIDKNKALTTKSGEDYIQIIAAMSRVENGVAAVMEDVEAGFKLQTKITR
jgi:hypothetical protein